MLCNASSGREVGAAARLPIGISPATSLPMSLPDTLTVSISSSPGYVMIGCVSALSVKRTCSLLLRSAS